MTEAEEGNETEEGNEEEEGNEDEVIEDEEMIEDEEDIEEEDVNRRRLIFRGIGSCVIETFRCCGSIFNVPIATLLFYGIAVGIIFGIIWGVIWLENIIGIWAWIGLGTLVLLSCMVCCCWIYVEIYIDRRGGGDIEADPNPENDYIAGGLPPKLYIEKVNFVKIGEDNEDSGNEEFECSICLDVVKPGKKVVELIECKHRFHDHCLREWLVKNQARCPTCKKLFYQRGDSESSEGELVPPIPT